MERGGSPGACWTGAVIYVLTLKGPRKIQGRIAITLSFTLPHNMLGGPRCPFDRSGGISEAAHSPPDPQISHVVLWPPLQA